MRIPRVSAAGSDPHRGAVVSSSGAEPLPSDENKSEVEGGRGGTWAGPRPGRPPRMDYSEPTTDRTTEENGARTGEEGRLPGSEEPLLRISRPQTGPGIGMRPWSLPVKSTSVNQDSVRESILVWI